MHNPPIQETLRPESAEQMQPVLWESKELCQSLFAHATDGLFLVSRNGRYVAVNQKYTEILGKGHEDLIGQPIDLLLPDEMKPAAAWVERTLREGTLGPYEIEVTTPLGLKVFSVNAFAYREKGIPVGIMCTARDVTEEHRHKEHATIYQLACDLARAADLRSITAHLFAQTQGLLRTDYEFLLFADTEGRELTGVAARGIDSEAFRQERVAVNKEISPVAKAFQQKQPVVVTEWAHSPLVSERLRQQYSFLGSLWVVPLMSGEKAIGVFALGYVASREATVAELRLLQMLGDEAALAIERARVTEELRESEDRYHSLFEHAHDGIICLTADGIVTSVNRGFEALLGWSREELIGKHYQTRHTPSSLALQEDRIRRLQAGEKVPSMYEVELVHKDGRVVPCEVRTRFIRNTAGKPIGVLAIVRDISARKQAEVVLRESEERWQLALRGANDGLWDWNLKTNEVFFSQQWKAMLGFEEHEIANHADEWARRVHPDDLGWVTQTLQDHLAQKTPFYLAEHRLLCKDGSYKWILARAQALWDAAGTAIRIVGSHTDTTERKRAEAALQENEERFRGAFDHAATGMALVAPDGRWLKANPSLCAIVGYSEQELLALDFQSITHPDDLEADLVQVRRVLAGELQTYQMEKRYLHKRGHVVWVLLGVSLVRDAQGAPLYFVSQVQDITARKRAEAALRESEERFRSLCTASPVGIFQNDLTGACVYTNARWQEITGMTLEESLGQGWANAIYSEDRESVFTEWQASVALGREFAKEFRFVRLTGEVCWVSSQASPLRSDDGSVIGYVGVTMDITDRKEVDRLKDEFVSVVSHELRTPLTSIRGSLGLLASGRLGTLQEKGQRMLDIAVANTDRLVRLINDILDIERMQSGKIAMQKQESNAADLMTQAAEVMRAMAEKAEVTLSVAPHSMRLWADPDRILQTLTNLLSNAIKFSSRGGTVWLTAEPQDGHLRFAVKDQGRGIPADKLDSIFERFQQVDASDSRDKGGTGLGLAICRSIVQQHGGHIGVESTLGVGSTFSFTLPTLNNVETTALEVSLPTPQRAVNGQARTACVLVAEDDSDLVRVLDLMLQRYGIESFCARTGREAIRLSQRLFPDLIILDLFMPDGDGFMVVNWLRQQNSLRHVPLIVYSAKDLDADERERLKLGPTQFFTKGRVKPEEFEQRVIEFLNHILAQRGEEQNNGNQADFGH